MLERFPQSAHYTSVYDECGLLGAKSLLGHGIHLTDQERRTLCHCQSSMVHCPSANLRLGSELMDYQKLAQVPVPVALGSDVAAGTSLSMFSVARDAVEVNRRLGGAAVLGPEHELGSLEPGKWADFTVLEGVELCDDALQLSRTLLKCDVPPTVKSVYIAGHCRYTRPA